METTETKKEDTKAEISAPAKNLIAFVFGVIVIIASLLLPFAIDTFLAESARDKQKEFDLLNPDFKNSPHILGENNGVYKVYDMKTGKPLNKCVITTKEGEVWESNEGVAVRLSGNFFKNIFPSPLLLSVSLLVLGIILTKIKKKEETQTNV